MRHEFWRLYRLVCLPTGKAYIGLTSKTVEARLLRHLAESRAGRGSNRPLYRAIRKYGVDRFSVQWIASSPTRQGAADLEIALISGHGTRSPDGYNLTIGGEGAVGLSPETRARIGEANRRHLTGRAVSPEHGAAVSRALKGKPKSDAHRESIRRARTGVPRPDVSAKAKGRIISQEQREAISRKLSGRTLSDAHKAAMRVGSTGRVKSLGECARISAGKKGKSVPWSAARWAADAARRERIKEQMMSGLPVKQRVSGEANRRRRV